MLLTGSLLVVPGRIRPGHQGDERHPDAALVELPFVPRSGPLASAYGPPLSDITISSVFSAMPSRCKCLDEQCDLLVDALQHRGEHRPVGRVVGPGLGLVFGDQVGLGRERGVHRVVGQVQEERLGRRCG